MPRPVQGAEAECQIFRRRHWETAFERGRRAIHGWRAVAKLDTLCVCERGRSAVKLTTGCGWSRFLARSPHGGSCSGWSDPETAGTVFVKFFNRRMEVRGRAFTVPKH